MFNFNSFKKQISILCPRNAIEIFNLKNQQKIFKKINPERILIFFLKYQSWLERLKKINLRMHRVYLLPLP